MANVIIHDIQTAVPATCYSQDEARERIKQQLDDRRARRIVHRIYSQSGIERRFTAVDSFGSDLPGALFGSRGDGKFIVPGTRERNARYIDVSKPLAIDVARRALDGQSGFLPAEVTHVITVSCTGFYNPGPDYHIVRELELSPATQRFQLGFMGCYAAFPALRMAHQFCLADPRAVVLVVCVELCTLHLQLDGENVDAMLAGSLFADGAAAAVVSARSPRGSQAVYRIQGLDADLLPAGEDAMTWDIGDHGFEIVLSTYVPSILGGRVASIVSPLLARKNLTRDDIAAWAVHPGGRAILDRVRDGLGLDEAHLAASRRILRDYGNMSSPTILFVLKELLEAEIPAAGDRIAALAFGPGLTVEFALLDRIAALPPDPHHVPSAWSAVGHEVGTG